MTASPQNFSIMTKLLAATIHKAFPIAILLAFSTTAAATDPANTSDQTQFRGNEAHTGLYNDQSAYTSVKQRWTFQAGSAIRSTPLVRGNKLYFGSGDNFFYALDTSG